MNETVRSQFTVQEVVRDDIWLKDSKHGLTVAVEAASYHYDTELRRKIRRLSAGDLIHADLKSQNALRTMWIFDRVTLESELDECA